MEQIKDTIKSVIDDWAKNKKGPRERPIDGLLKKILTKKELRHIKFNYFKKSVLYLTVDSPVWLHQFNLHKEKLKSALKKDLAELKEIRFFIGELK